MLVLMLPINLDLMVKICLYYKKKIIFLFIVLHEAVTSTDPEFIRDVYEQKEMQRYSSRADGIPNLLSKICDVRY